MKKLILLLGVVFFTKVALADLYGAVANFEAQKYEPAYEEFNALANSGNATANFYLGRMYFEGLGVTKDNQKAMAYFQIAEEGQVSDATYYISKILAENSEKKYIDSTDFSEEYLKKAAYQGNSNALFDLGEKYYKGIGVEKDFNNAFGFFYMSAYKGNMKAQRRLAQMYFDGVGATQDLENAKKWMTRSANQGYVLAQMDLGDWRTLNPQMKNYLDAYSWYSIVAAYNSGDIQILAMKRRDALQKILLKDKNTEKNAILERQKKIRNWRPKRPEESVPREELLYVKMPIIPGFNDKIVVQRKMQSGEMVVADSMNYGISAELIKEAQSTKDYKKLNEVALMAEKAGKKDVYAFLGDTASKQFMDDIQAVKWYERGAKLGDYYAQYQYARALCDGTGLENPDIAQCYGWLLIAADSPDEAVKQGVTEALQTLKLNASPKEQEEGEQFAEKYKKRERDSSFSGNGGKYSFF